MSTKRSAKKVDAAIKRVLKQRRGREASIEQKGIDHAKARGWLARKMNGLGFRDWPDRLFIPRVRRPALTRFWVEFKKLGAEPTPSQAKMHVDLRARGETVYVCDNFEAFLVIFNRHNS